MQSLTDVLQNGCQACKFIKKRLQHRWFPVKFTEFFKTPFLTNTFTLVAASGSKQCIQMKTYAEILCCRESKEYLNGTLKGPLYDLRQFLTRETPLKRMKKVFHFTLKGLFFFKIFKFLSWLFWSCIKTAWLERSC